METAKLKHLKKCSKLLENSPILKLHFKSEIQRFQNIADGALKDQNEQFVQSKTSNVKAKNGQFECHWCFQVGSPVLKVRRYRPKGQKKLIKKATFHCKTCKKESLAREILPTLDPLKSRSIKPDPSKISIPKSPEDQDQKLMKKNEKKKRKKNQNAGLTLISPKRIKTETSSTSNFQNSSDKLKSLLQKELSETTTTKSRLEKMLN